MSTRNLLVIFTCLTASSLAASKSDAAWGDWLFGRTTSPYVAGYTPYAAGYAPVATGYAPYATGNAQHAAGYSPVVHSQMPASASVAAPVPTLGTQQVQMQTYDNPSVYSGRPVIMAPGSPQTAYRLPAGGTNAPIGGMNSAYRPFLGQSTPVPTLAPTVAPTLAPPTLAPPTLAPPTLAPTTLAPSAVAQTTYAAPVTGIGNGLTFAPMRSGGEVPLGRVLRRANTSSNPFYGTGNIYPNNFGSAPTAAPYQAAYPTTTIQLPTAAPLTATAMAPSVSPLFPNAPQPRLGGLSRFFGSRLGTRYQTSYYQAPITYYRPVTSIDPVTGTTVTIQQGCSSYVQQLQRTPYNTFQGQVFNGAAIGSAGCNSGNCPVTAYPTQIAPSTYGPAGQYPGSQYAPISPMATDPNAIGQVGGVASPSDRNVIPIPSTEPSAGYYQQPNMAPLTGRPPGTGDLEAVDQPRLESARPPADEDYYRDGLFRRDVTPFADEEKASVEPSSFMQERVYKHSMPELSSPPIDYTPRQTQTEPQLPDPKLSPADLVVAAPTVPSDTTYSDVRPIRAPESFKAPFPPREYNASDSRPTGAADRSPSLFAPELPAAQRSNFQQDNFQRRIDTRDANSASVRVSVPVREATMTRGAQREIQPVTKPVRDSGGWLPMGSR